MIVLNGVEQDAIRQKYDKFEGYDIFVKSVNVTGNNNSYNVNVFKFTGTIQIVCQFAEITNVVDASNMTNVYADIWDGTNSVSLTANTTMSGLTVGSFFSKINDATQPYVVHIADECRMTEPGTKTIGYPFLITAKNGVDNYIRFNYTTNTTLDFTMDVRFVYKLIDGGSLTIA